MVARRRGSTGRCRRWPAPGRGAWRRSARWAWRAAPPPPRDRIASTRRASLPVICASSRARSLGSSVARSTIAPLRLRDDLAGHDQDVARARRDAVALQRRDQQRGQVVAGRTCGMPPSAAMVSPELLKVCPVPEVLQARVLADLRGGDAGDADAGAVDLVVAVDADEHARSAPRPPPSWRAGRRARRAGRRPWPAPAPPRGPSGRRRRPARRSRSASSFCSLCAATLWNADTTRTPAPEPLLRGERGGVLRRQLHARDPAAAPAARWCRPPACRRRAARSRRGWWPGSPRAR